MLCWTENCRLSLIVCIIPYTVYCNQEQYCEIQNACVLNLVHCCKESTFLNTMKKYVTFYYTLLSTSKTQGDNVSSCVICSQWNAHDSNLHQRFNFIIIVSLFMFTAGLRLLPQAFHRSSLVKPKSFFPPEFFYSMPPLSWMSSPTSSHCYPDAPPDSVLHARPKPTFFFSISVMMSSIHAYSVTQDAHFLSLNVTFSSFLSTTC